MMIRKGNMTGGNFLDNHDDDDDGKYKDEAPLAFLSTAKGCALLVLVKIAFVFDLIWLTVFVFDFD